MRNDFHLPSELPDQLKESSEWETIKNRKKVEYFNLPCAFDIETTSFYDSRREKASIMYEWTFAIMNTVYIGRTWEEFISFMDTLSTVLALDENRRLVVYVHNLAYEFQFIRTHFEWCSVFAISRRKPAYAVTTTGIEFRCSYILSGYALSTLAKNLQWHEIRKLVGDLDYSLLRHSKTPLTDDEVNYCINDVKIVIAYIEERIKADGDITKIPLTKTGYVRRYCRNECLYSEMGRCGFQRLRYMDYIKSLTLEPEEYKQLKRGFQGGFTHANPFFSGKTVENVASYDFTSSYPAVMVSEMFPMSSSEVVQIRTKKDLDLNLRLYCCLFDVHFIGLKSKVFYDSYISESRSWGVKKAVTNNGRVVSADELYLTVTEQDYMIISAMYSWDRMEIGTFRRYRKAYLPTHFIKAILSLYRKKTELKGVEGSEEEYLNSKEMLNSCYGMTVTDIIREVNEYDTEWKEPVIPDLEESVSAYNESKGRFLFYPWGVWVTAYARRNLFTGIFQCGNDYIYSDTDSIKLRNPENHRKYFEDYNEMIRKKMLNAMRYHKLGKDWIEPETIKGKRKLLGAWDYEGEYSRFKTLGAKRYMVEEDGEVNITVSGLNKKVCVPYLKEKYGKDIFENFNKWLYIPSGKTGKNTHTYIDEKRTGVLTDYTGISTRYRELSGVHLEEADYSLSITKEYEDYITGIQYDAI